MTIKSSSSEIFPFVRILVPIFEIETTSFFPRFSKDLRALKLGDEIGCSGFCKFLVSGFLRARSQQYADFVSRSMKEN